MLIDEVSVHHVRMPLVEVWRTAAGDETGIDTVLVSLRSGEVVEWGEASPWGRPLYSADWASAEAELITTVIAPTLVGRDVATSSALTALLAPIKGNYFAKAAVDAAWWALLAALDGVALSTRLGATLTDVSAGADFGVLDSIDELLESIDAASRTGVPRVKLKFRPGWELDVVRAVRSHFPTLTLHVDCNSGYTLDDMSMFRQLDQLDLAMIEQPLQHDDLVDHASLSRALDTPICLDESIVSARHLRQAAELGSCRIVNIKPARVGGLTEALRVRETATEHGITCWVGNMLESGVGAAAAIAFASLGGFGYPHDIFPTSRFYYEDLATPEPSLGRRGAPWVADVPTRPGVGAAPHPDRLARWSIRSTTVGPGPHRRSGTPVASVG